MIRTTLCALLLAVACLAQDAEPTPKPDAEPASKQLLTPTGKYGVSRISYDWADKTRIEPTAKIPGDHREILVYIWYPTDKNRKDGRAEYLPGVDAIANSREVNASKEFWGDAWPQVSLGAVRIDASEAAPLPKGKDRFPLLIFSPGLGVNSTAYSTLIAEVVSRGYVVAAIEPTFEAPAVAFSDGRVIGLSEDATGRRQSPEGASKQEFLKRLHDFDLAHFDKWAGDIRLTIDEVTGLNASEADDGQFSGRIDLANIAAWGHAFGGRAAAHACQLDSRIKACLDEDGSGEEGPIFPFEDAGMPTQPFLWIEPFHNPPSDDQLSAFHITREAWDKDHEERLANSEKELKACSGGSYHLTINRPGIEHFSFTDRPLIEAKSQEETDQATHAMEVIEQYSIAFFDRFLKKQEGGLLEKTAKPPDGVTLEQFGGATK